MKPVLLDIPTELETERCWLKAPKVGDGKAVNKAIVSSINELRPWLPFAQVTPTPDDTEENTRQAVAKFISREALRYLIFHKESGRLIGSTGFHNIDWDFPKMEIGYWLDTAWSGQGYMTEAVGKLTTFALEELSSVRVEIRCERLNEKSRRIPESLGYELEGVLRNEDFAMDGKTLTDTCIYAKVKEA